MNYRCPAALSQLPSNLTVRRQAIHRQDFTPHVPSRHETSQHLTAAEYQAARLRKRLKEWLTSDQGEVASALLNEVVEAYQQALISSAHKL